MSFKDTGIGFEPDQLEAVWEAFRQADGSFSRAHQGVGIGLPLCKALIEQMGGSISLSSKQGVGTEAVVRIPVTLDLQVTNKSSAQPDSQHSTTPLNILVVEDNPINMKLTQKMLERIGFQSIPAWDGKQAMDIYDKSHDTIGLILMDCQMPVMNGYDATKNIRKIEGGDVVPIIALTANVSETDVKTCLASGMNDHMGKPVSIETLKGKITHWLSQRAISEN